MPFYEYQCGNCDHKLEILQKISDEPLIYCPECNEASLKKLISAAAFRLKGTGWYETDFKSSDKKKESDSSDKSTDSDSSKEKSAKKESGEKTKSTSKINPNSSGVTASKSSNTSTSALA